MKIVFFGTPDFAVPTLLALVEKHEVVMVVAQPDKPSGRGMSMHPPAVAVTAKELGLPLLQPPRARDPLFLDTLRGIGPELGVVVAYGKILAPALLTIPRLGFLNIHGSILPRYRGAAPIQRAIEAGELKTGVTIMRVDDELDHGPILSIAETPIGAEERSAALAVRLSGIGAAALLPVIDALANGTAVETAQDHGDATHAAKLEKHEGLVTWKEPAVNIHNRYRAFDPWPGVFAECGGEPIKLFDLSLEACMQPHPGRIASIGPAGVVIEAAEGALRIRTMQQAGRSRVHAEELIRSFGLQPGSLFV